MSPASISQIYSERDVACAYAWLITSNHGVDACRGDRDHGERWRPGIYDVLDGDCAD